MDGSQGESYWRERAEQLQHALTSRIVIEQAKGVLAERLGLDMEGAFAVIRYAARSARIKLQDLAQQIVEREDTPEEVLRAVAQHSTTLAPLDVETFLCECSDPGCMVAIRVPHEALRRLHGEANTFVVVKGHELPDVETVIDDADGYFIVRKDASTGTTPPR